MYDVSHLISKLLLTARSFILIFLIKQNTTFTLLEVDRQLIFIIVIFSVLIEYCNLIVIKNPKTTFTLSVPCTHTKQKVSPALLHFASCTLLSFVNGTFSQKEYHELTLRAP